MVSREKLIEIIQGREPTREEAIDIMQGRVPQPEPIPEVSSRQEAIDIMQGRTVQVKQAPVGTGARSRRDIPLSPTTIDTSQETVTGLGEPLSAQKPDAITAGEDPRSEIDVSQESVRNTGRIFQEAEPLPQDIITERRELTPDPFTPTEAFKEFADVSFESFVNPIEGVKIIDAAIPKNIKPEEIPRRIEFFEPRAAVRAVGAAAGIGTEAAINFATFGTGSVSRFIGRTVSRGKDILKPETRLFVPTKFERGEIIFRKAFTETPEGIAFGGTRTRVEPKTTFTIGTDEFSKLIKTGDIEGFEIIKPGRFFKSPIVDIPTERFTTIDVRRVPGADEISQTTFERLRRGTPSFDKPLDITDTTFLGKGERRTKTFSPTEEIIQEATGGTVTKTRTPTKKRPETGMSKVASETPIETFEELDFAVPIGRVEARPPSFAGLGFVPALSPSFRGDLLDASGFEFRTDIRDLDATTGLTEKITDNVFEGQSTGIGSFEGIDIFQAQVQGQPQGQFFESSLFQDTAKATARGRGQGKKLKRIVPLLFPELPITGEELSRVSGKRPGYDTFIKEKGRVRKLNKKVRTKKGALALGANFVDNTPVASFTIRKSKKNAELNGGELWDVLQNKFTPRKTKNALELVEKNQFRIDRPGELKGITQKGIDVRRVL